MPGATLFTITPERTPSRARVLVRAMTPPLHAEYTASPIDPTLPASEARLTILPPDSCSLKASRAARLMLMGPFRLMLITLSHMAGSLFMKGSITSQPALLIRASIRPNAFRFSATVDLASSREVTSHLTKRASPPFPSTIPTVCLLYTSDAADDLTRVDLGG